MSIEPRNEQQMLRQFWKKHPTYNLNAMMRKRYEELMDARAFNEWLQNRQLKRQGEEYADAMGRVTETVNRRIPQLCWAGAERRQVLRAARKSPRRTKQSMEEQRAFGFHVRPRFAEALEYIEEGEPLKLPLPDRMGAHGVTLPLVTTNAFLGSLVAFLVSRGTLST